LIRKGFHITDHRITVCYAELMEGGTEMRYPNIFGSGKTIRGFFAHIVTFFLLICLSTPSMPALSRRLSQSMTVTETTAKSICLNPNKNLHLNAYVFYGGYLFCSTSDDHTGGQALFKQESDGTFDFVRSSSELYRAIDLVQLEQVPQATADYLVTTMNQKLAALPKPTPTPTPKNGK
jgi:hypothetical protein